MSTLTTTQTAAIRAYLAGRNIPTGLGTAEEACSITAINLALTGRLTDEIPNCMSEVVGRWMIAAQDKMSDEVRNGRAWRSLIPRAAGTGRDKEQERKALILDWMWTWLARVQPVADKGGYGSAAYAYAAYAYAYAAADDLPAAAVKAAAYTAYAAAAAAAAVKAKPEWDRSCVTLLRQLVKA